MQSGSSDTIPHGEPPLVSSGEAFDGLVWLRERGQGGQGCVWEVQDGMRKAAAKVYFAANPGLEILPRSSRDLSNLVLPYRRFRSERLDRYVDLMSLCEFSLKGYIEALIISQDLKIEALLTDVTQDIAEAIHQSHTMLKLRHRDVKASNIVGAWVGGSLRCVSHGPRFCWGDFEQQTPGLTRHASVCPRSITGAKVCQVSLGIIINWVSCYWSALGLSRAVNGFLDRALVTLGPVETS